MASSGRSKPRYRRSRSRSRSPSSRNKRRPSPEEDSTTASTRRHRESREELNRRDRDKWHDDRSWRNRRDGVGNLGARTRWQGNDDEKLSQGKWTLDNVRKERKNEWMGHDNRWEQHDSRGQRPRLSDRREDDRNDSVGRNYEEDRRYGGDKRLDKGGRGSFRGRRNSRTDDNRVRQIVVNPTEVPKSTKYYTHDDREGRGSIRGTRKPVTFTPMKWGHDMFDKMLAGTPPPEGGDTERVDEARVDEGHDPLLNSPQEVLQDLLYPEPEV